MISKIWRELAQILFYRNDLIETIKPFFENLKNDNINDEKYIPLLKTFSKDQLEVLYQKGIIAEERFKLLIAENQSFAKETNNLNDIKSKIEEIISGDNIKELEKLLQKSNNKSFKTITKSFFEVEEMEIPLIQYCIMKNAIECFKYLLVNGYDDPNKTMKEKDPDYNEMMFKFWGTNYLYEWDCMATALYFGNKEIVQILEYKGIEKGKPAHIEAAILSYRNIFATQLIENLDENAINHKKLKISLNLSIIASARNNNIKGVEFLLTKGVSINIQNKQFNSF